MSLRKPSSQAADGSVADAPAAARSRYGIEPGPQRRVEQMGVSLRRLHLGVPQEFADHLE